MNPLSSLRHALQAATFMLPAVVLAASADQTINAAPPSPVSNICGRIVDANLYSCKL
jgi:hypothetical protein